MTVAIGFQPERGLQAAIRTHSRVEHWRHALQAHPLLRRFRLSQSFFKFVTQESLAEHSFEPVPEPSQCAFGFAIKRLVVVASTLLLMTACCCNLRGRPFF